MKRLYQRLILLLRGLSIRLRLTLLILTLILLSLLATVVCYFSARQSMIASSADNLENVLVQTGKNIDSELSRVILELSSIVNDFTVMHDTRDYDGSSFQRQMEIRTQFRNTLNSVSLTNRSYAGGEIWSQTQKIAGVMSNISGGTLESSAFLQQAMNAERSFQFLGCAPLESSTADRKLHYLIFCSKILSGSNYYAPAGCALFAFSESSFYRSVFSSMQNDKEIYLATTGGQILSHSDKLLLAAQDTGIANAARAWQLKNDSAAGTAEELNARMAEALSVMRDAAEKGLDPNLRSVSRLTGGNAAKLMQAAVSGQTMGGSLLGRICARALAVAECNAAMGRIVAAPTAGACGILPGALLTVQEEYGYTDDQLVDALFVAGAFGLIIANRASISGAQGGCQAECGSAAGMTAAGLTTLRGGSPRQAADACAFALMNLLGLVCDPVRGLVEVPCVFRNVGAVSIALSAADLALAGVTCPIPCDEVIDAMRQVGDTLPASLRETGEGGCAACPSVCERRASL